MEKKKLGMDDFPSYKPPNFAYVSRCEKTEAPSRLPRLLSSDRASGWPGDATLPL